MPCTITVNCDHCGQDLTNTAEAPAFRLVLAAEPIMPVSQTAGGVDAFLMKAVHVKPPLATACYFCSLACLRDWLDRRATGGQ